MKCKRLILGILLIFASVCLFSEEVKKSEENKESIFTVILSKATEEDICKKIQENKYSKAEINSTDSNGYTPLYLAIDSGKPKVMEFLLKKGANKNKITNIKVRDRSGRKILRCSPVLYASWKGNKDCLSLLLEKGAKVNIESDMILPTSDGITYIRLLLPIDAAFYNRRNIKFNDIHDLLATKELDYQHYHFSGRKWGYGKYKTHDLLKEYGLLKNNTSNK